MSLKSVITAVVAAALAVAPTAAIAQNAAPAPVPAEERAEGSEYRGGIMLPLAAIIAIVIAVLLLTKDDKRRSP